MPVVQSCSLAIAAACHQQVTEREAFKRLVQWGEIPCQMGGEDNVGHCTFSENMVLEPRLGRLYA